MTTDVPAALEASVNDALDTARSYKVDSPMMYEAARADLIDIKEIQRYVDETEKAAKAPYQKAINAIRANFEKPKEFIALAVKTLTHSISAWEREQERKRIAAAKEAADAAEAERKRLQAQAEAAERVGNAEAADAMRAASTMVQVVPEPVAVAKRPSDGLQKRVTWSAEVFDLQALVKAVATGEQPITLLEPNMTALNGMARSLREALARAVPGVRAVDKTGYAARRK